MRTLDGSSIKAVPIKQFKLPPARSRSPCEYIAKLSETSIVERKCDGDGATVVSFLKLTINGWEKYRLSNFNKRRKWNFFSVTLKKFVYAFI